MSFFRSDRVVLDTLGHDEELAFAEMDVAIAELDGHLALQDEEQLVFVLVSVPNELSLEFHELHVMSVQLANDLWAPEVREQLELLLEVDFLHYRTDSDGATEQIFYGPV